MSRIEFWVHVFFLSHCFRSFRNVFDGTRWLGDDPSSGFLVRLVFFFTVFLSFEEYSYIARYYTHTKNVPNSRPWVSNLWLWDSSQKPSFFLRHRGVDSDRVGVPQVGLLSELETYRYLSVGMMLGLQRPTGFFTPTQRQN